ncbi:hsp70 nucleotide exchange factor fes1 [Blyttiomyces sp. JEL0837]|nr:hsp70 nucleotide exchange factor fes1 [Blyttiomyces sp. JEL0837]
MSPITQTDLLQWAILNRATANEDAPAPAAMPEGAEQLDPKWVDVMLGKSDSLRMKESVQILTDPSKSLDEKLTAFDELEMLVESLDNANDLKTLGLWPPIITILANDTNAEMRAFAAWVIGTAVQNNEQSQKDFLEANGLPTLLKALQDDTDPEVRAKCMTSLSSLVRHNPLAITHLQQAANPPPQSSTGAVTLSTSTTLATLSTIHPSNCKGA